jgi:hypothetical protein
MGSHRPRADPLRSIDIEAYDRHAEKLREELALRGPSLEFDGNRSVRKSRPKTRFGDLGLETRPPQRAPVVARALSGGRHGP